MKLTIVEYPDKKLKEKSKVVEKFGKELHELLDAMYETMLKSNGIGL
ncbi:peptide deformylase, partial [Sulfurimonas sp. RIFCSPLOWO2_12_36_12]